MPDYDKLKEAIKSIAEASPGNVIISPTHVRQAKTIWCSDLALVLDAAKSTLPKTKMVETWHVEFADLRLEQKDTPYPCVNAFRRESSAHGRARELENSKRDGVAMYACIRVTGPHMQEVPA